MHAETFERVSNEIAAAWNRAMIWIDDEVVFARLNTLLTVTKEATERVIEAALRAQKKAANKFENGQTNVNSLSPNDVREQQETIPKPVKQSGAIQIYKNRPQPLPTRGGNLSPTRRVHIRVSQTNVVNVQSGKLMLETSFSG